MQTRERSFIRGRSVGNLPNMNFTVDSMDDVDSLGDIGIEFDRRALNTAMDSLNPTLSAPSLGFPVQFVQTWMPGFVKYLTAPRLIDELVGISTLGAWSDEQVVQGTLERTGRALIYDDYTNIPLSSYNPGYIIRNVIRFEEGMLVGKLAEARAARVNIDEAAIKRDAAAMALDIARNDVGFFGFNNGVNNTYGFLTDPNEPAYITVAEGASASTLWSTKTYLEITKDLRAAFQQLRTQTQGLVDPKRMQLTLGLPTDDVDFLTVTSDFGNSVQEWLDENYPETRVISAPQLNNANGGANVFYLFADFIPEQSTDDGRTFTQIVPTRFLLLGVENRAKGYLEDYSNATAGVMVKRPFAMVRYTGI